MAVELTTTRVVITGTSGFIGTHLVQFLKSHSINPIPFTGDITDEQRVDSFFRDHKPDMIIHLAGIHAGSREDLEKINGMGTKNIVHIGATYGCRYFMFASSAAVYGNVAKKSGAEESDDLNPNVLYGESKRNAELAVQEAAKLYGMKTAILRLGAVYGPGQKSGIIPVMMQSIQKDHVVQYDSSNPVTRQFIHVSDVANIVHRLLEQDFTGVVNVASDDVFTLSELADILASRFVFTREHRPVSTSYTDMRVNISKLKSVDDCKPVHSLRQYLLQ